MTTPGLGSRLLIGGIAGLVGTLAMTSTMARLHRRLPARQRYPLTPREIIDSVAAELGAELGNGAAKDTTIAAHFAYGAACGALLGAANPNPGKASGALAGAAVWLSSYMGWIPAAGILKPATRHPAERNLLMVGAHLVWGAATAQAMGELMLARATMLEQGPDRDRPEPAEPA